MDLPAAPPPPPPKPAPPAAPPPPPKPQPPTPAAGFEVDTDLLARFTTTLTDAHGTLSVLNGYTQQLATAMDGGRKAFDTPQHATECINTINGVAKDLGHITSDTQGMSKGLATASKNYSYIDSQFAEGFTKARQQLEAAFTEQT